MLQCAILFLLVFELMAADELNFIMRWKAIGQFPPSADEIPKQLDPNFMVKLLKDSKGDDIPRRIDGKSASWLTIEAEEKSGLVNLGMLPGGFKNQTLSVAVTQVWVPEERKVTFSLGADYWSLLMLNGNVIINRSLRTGPPAPDEIRQEASLTKGWNTILVGVVSGSGGSAFWLATIGGPPLLSHPALAAPRVSPDEMAADPETAAIKSVSEKNREDNFWIKPATRMMAFTKIDAGKPIAPVNRKVLGACLMYPPVIKPENKNVDYGRFSDAFIEAVRPFLQDAGVRIWMHPPNSSWNSWWQDFAGKLGTRNAYAFVNMGWRKEKVSYKSEEDNNLYSTQTPKAFADYVKITNSGKNNSPKILNWELWNEPTFDVNGGWDPVEHAKWCADAARRMKEVDPDISIGPHIYGGGPWNEKMLEALSKEGPDLFGFIVNHYYDTAWFQQWDTYGSYLGRVAYPELIRKQARRDLALIDKYGKGKWKLVISEWNSHPQRYDWPGKISHDMATALFQASTVQVFAKEGVDAAQVFLLHGGAGAFGLIGDKDANVRHPPFHMFELYGQYYKGMRLSDETASPTFCWRHDLKKVKSDPIQIPYVDILASKNEGQIIIMAVNKHPDSPVCLEIEITGLEKKPARALISSVMSDDKESDKAFRKDSEVILKGEKISITLPEHSFSAIRLE